MTKIMQTGQQLSHRNISHSVSSVDLIGPCLTTQPKIHILKISDATCIGATVYGLIADPGIDKRGADLKSEASNEVFWGPSHKES